jgi:hypothetical protein
MTSLLRYSEAHYRTTSRHRVPKHHRHRRAHLLYRALARVELRLALRVTA